MKFLCDKHRQLLRQFPSLAELRWEQWMNEGLASLVDKNWPGAIRNYGCCYEMGEWFYTDPKWKNYFSAWDGMDKLMVSGHLLAESYGRSGDTLMERHILLAVHRRLTSKLSIHPRCSTKKFKKNIEISLVMLERHCSHNGSFGGLDVCVLQAQALLNKMSESAQI